MKKPLILAAVGIAILFFLISVFDGAENTRIETKAKEVVNEIAQTVKETEGNTSVDTKLNAKSETETSSKTISNHTPSLKVLGTEAWISWLRTLPVEEQHNVLRKIEASSYPDGVSAEEWKKAAVKNGPGQAEGEVFPCKLLTDYQALLRPRKGLGVVGLQFSINREGDSILTTIWSQNAKDAITVDWTNNKIFPAFNMKNVKGIGVTPSSTPYELHLHGDNGKMAVSNSVLLPWRPEVLASQLAVHKDSPVWFGAVFAHPRQLESIICAEPSQPKILGEIKMPAGKSLIWCLFDMRQKVLLIVDHSWDWIAMIDFAKLPVDAENRDRHLLKNRKIMRPCKYQHSSSPLTTEQILSPR